MYIAVCDDQTEELKDLTELLGAWETDRGTPVRVKSFRSAAERCWTRRAMSASRCTCSTS